MKFGSIKTKNSRIPVLPRLAWRKRRLASLRKSGMVLVGLVFSGFVLAQIPYSEGKVYVCPLAKSIKEINPRCQCRIDLILGETVKSNCPLNGKSYEMTLTITEHEGKEYFAILEFESGGAGVNFKPEAQILAPSQALVGQNILFDGSKSFDENEDSLDFLWDFGDKNSSQGEKVFHSFERAGEYTITLKVSDGMDVSFATFTLKVLPSQNFSGGKIAFYEKKEKKEETEIEKKERIEKEEKAKEIADTPLKEKEIFEKPKEKEVEKITKILKIEKPEKEKEPAKESAPSKENERKEKEKKPEQKIFSQNFPSLFLASLKETILNPKVFLFLIFSVFLLTILLVRKIKLRSK